MTNILNFKPRAESKSGQRSPETPADIIIFPGIRYERMEGNHTVSARRDIALRSTATVPALLQG
ncbi:hypothetical protein ACFOEZ_02795 [Tianweitania populi]|nr:hypothetical protein [Tianweitania populi]